MVDVSGKGFRPVRSNAVLYGAPCYFGSGNP